MNNIKEFRQTNKVTQAELASYLGVGQSFIASIESGKSPLPKDKLQLIKDNKSWDTSMLIVDTTDTDKSSDRSKEVELLRSENALLRKQIDWMQSVIDRLTK